MIFIMGKVGSRTRFVQYFSKECQSYYRQHDVHSTSIRPYFIYVETPNFLAPLRLCVKQFLASLRLCVLALCSSLRLCTPRVLALGVQSPPFAACACYTVLDRQAGKVVPKKGESGFFEILFNSGNSCGMMNPRGGKCEILACENIEI